MTSTAKPATPTTPKPAKPATPKSATPPSRIAALPITPTTPSEPPNRFAATLRSCVAADWGAILERTARLTAHPIALTLTARDAARHYATSLRDRLSDFATRLGY